MLDHIAVVQSQIRHLHRKTHTTIVDEVTRSLSKKIIIIKNFVIALDNQTLVPQTKKSVHQKTKQKQNCRQNDQNSSYLIPTTCSKI